MSFVHLKISQRPPFVYKAKNSEFDLQESSWSGPTSLTDLLSFTHTPLLSISYTAPPVVNDLFIECSNIWRVLPMLQATMISSGDTVLDVATLVPAFMEPYLLHSHAFALWPLCLEFITTFPSLHLTASQRTPTHLLRFSAHHFLVLALFLTSFFRLKMFPSSKGIE